MPEVGSGLDGTRRQSNSVGAVAGRASPTKVGTTDERIMKSIVTKTDKKIRTAPPCASYFNPKFPRRAFDPIAYAAALEILG